MDLRFRQEILRWLAAVVGVCTGAMHVKTGIQALFTLSAKDGWTGLVGTLAAGFTLLPFSLLGFFRPRLAAYLLLGSFGVLVFALLFSGDLKSSFDVFRNGSFWLVYVLPFCGIAGVLLYASNNNASAKTECMMH
jgi:hypothetical protein